MVNTGLFIKIDVKQGQADLELLLCSGVLLVQDDPSTIAWFAICMSPSIFRHF